MMNNELRYEAVNKCETLEELALVIKSFSDEFGMIQGRSRQFDALRMSQHCKQFNYYNVNTLTRQWGIRQQALYILYNIIE
jgi:hypothetical protein